MNTRHKQPDFPTKYLIGDLPEPEREPFEESYFTDEEVFAELLETENKLIADYLHGRLARREKELFERNYLGTPCGQRNLELAWLMGRSETAKSILNDGREKEEEEPPAPRTSRFQSLLRAAGAFKPAIWIPATASLLIAAAIGTAMLRNSAPEPAASLPSGTANPATPPPGEIIERVTLEPSDVVRSGSVGARPQSDSTLRTGTATKYVELKLLLDPPAYSKYRGQVLSKESRAKITSEDSLLPETEKTEKFVRWKIEAEALPQGDYSVELRGVKPGGETVDPGSYDLKVRAR